jgi:hypothetical protein
MDTAIPVITSESEDGFVDLVFAATGGTRQADGRFRLHAVGEHDGRRVGFGVVLGPTWERRKVDDNLVVRWGTVGLVSLGEASDSFLRTLDLLYGASVGAARMVAETTVTAVALEGDPAHAPHDDVRMKLFFEHDDQDRYGEFYLNIDFAARRVEFHEKNEGYRKAVVRGLSQDAG